MIRNPRLHNSISAETLTKLIKLLIKHERKKNHPKLFNSKLISMQSLRAWQVPSLGRRVHFWIRNGEILKSILGGITVTASYYNQTSIFLSWIFLSFRMPKINNVSAFALLSTHVLVFCIFMCGYERTESTRKLKSMISTSMNHHRRHVTFILHESTCFPYSVHRFYIAAIESKYSTWARVTFVN